MSMKKQREYGMSSTSMHLRPVDSRLCTMGVFSEPMAAPYKAFFPLTNPVLVLADTG
jgi:hypothetical protein